MKTNLWLSLLISILVGSASILGILNPATYAKETENWALQAVGQDLGNIIALPLFLLSSYFLHRNSFRAYLLWLGSLFYFIYAYLIYAFFIHFNYLFLVYVSILGLSFFTLVGSLLSIELKEFRGITGKEVKTTCLVLITIGVLFVILWLSEIIPALLEDTTPKSAQLAGLLVNPIQVIDLSVVLPSMVLTGILLWRRNKLGFIFAAPWLTFSILMGSSIIITLTMEMAKGNSSAVTPLAVVTAIVVVSMFSLYLYLRKLT